MEALRTPPGGGTLALPDLIDPHAWIAVTSGLSTLRIAEVTGPDNSRALCLDYDFGAGAGFVVARREIVLEMPAAWELRVLARTTGPANALEIKLVDASGASVWRWTGPRFDTSGEWKEVRIPSREFVFAWGPAGGGSIECTSAIEIAVVASPGGDGALDLAGFEMFDRSPGRAAAIAATNSLEDHEAADAIDHDAGTYWQSTSGAGPHELTIDFDEMRDIGGVVVTWLPGATPHAFRIDVAGAAGAWTSAYDSPASVARKSFVSLSLLDVRSIRLVMTADDAGAGVGVVEIDVRPFEWSRTPVEFLTNVALGRRRGAWPRYLLREQTYWTPVATPQSGPVGLLNDDGAVEVGEGGFLLEPSLLFTTGEAGAAKWITWADVDHSVCLLEPPLPVASVTWKPATLDPGELFSESSNAVVSWNATVETSAIAEDARDEDVLLVRYRLRAAESGALRAKLLVAIRPLQVTPPWQSFRGLGGPSPITKIECRGGTVCVGDAAWVTPLAACNGFGAASFEEGGLAEELTRGVLPTRSRVEDPAGRAEGVLGFVVELGAGQSTDVFVECRHRRSRPRVPMGAEIASAEGEARAHDADYDAAPRTAPRTAQRTAKDPSERFAAALDCWRRTLTTPSAAGSPGLVSVWGSVATAVAHILACRDGAALQPGPRRYSRSWIRDGVIMAAALLRTDRADAARAFLRWYAPFQREDGFVPSCVDRDGVDPLVEHDSHGQLVYAVAELYRFTHDIDLVRELWPRCARAAAYIESVRETRRTVEFESGERKACYGLLPESVSHEGYLAQPVHSYWDDFWALRGLQDAAFLARELGMPGEAGRWGLASADLAARISDSIREVMRERHLATVPASVEWADFDPTAIAGAISLVGAGDLFPADALARTFDQYMKGLRARFHGTIAWNNYSPYEVRIVGALVRLGRRDDANELLQSMLADRRPVAWRQWPEIVWPDIGSPAHLGDLPHCWIGAEFVIALRSMFVYERELDSALVIGAGLRREWIDADSALELQRLPTWYGMLDLSIRRESPGNYRIRVSGATPPGGFVAELPDGCRATIEHV